MKKIFFTALFSLISVTYIHAQTINIGDSRFKVKLLEANTDNNIANDSLGFSITIDINNDNEIQQSEAKRVYKLNVRDGNIFSMDEIEFFPNIQILDCSNNFLSNLDFSHLLNLKELHCNNNRMTGINLMGLSKLEIFNCSNNEFGGFDLNAFGLTNLRQLNCSFNEMTHLLINNLINLTDVQCNRNRIASLNVSNLTGLINLDCSDNQNMSSLNVGALTNLINFSCANNQLLTLNSGSLINLKNFNCANNQISVLNVDSMINLISLDCSGNNLTQLNVTNLTNIERLFCSYNELTQLDLHNLIKLKQFSCDGNNLYNLNISGLINLIEISCNHSNLKSIYMKDGFNSSGMITNSFSFYIPGLQFICADESEFAALQQKLTAYNFTNVSINSLCGAYLEGTHYVLKGNVKFDYDNNGCAPSDPPFPFLKINVNSTYNNGYTFIDENGDYILALDNSTYTLTPQLPNNYFSCTPLSSTITFPYDTTSQPFCIAPNGIHHDVEISIVPVRGARPGFSDATYRIVLRNKGNQNENGTILFSYDDDLQDYILATQTPLTVSSGLITFDFSNLQLFETRVITITMRTNAPSDNPAVNTGDILQLSVTANLNNGINDEYFKDNFQSIKQIVVGSYDPNDKTCLEGDIITPRLIGDYVHYLIRFENTGTANAENVVVTDFIDLNTFDISTFELTSTSHNCKTLISNGNKVQFVFDNINLPFTEPLKHGYVAFKIKLKDDLVIGDSLKNHADIYFDYNLPITTNTATSRIENVTAIKSNSKKDGNLNVYPNPSNGNFIVNFESLVSQSIIVKIIAINGNVVYEQNLNHINQSQLQIKQNLSAGVYLITINSEKEQYVQKLIITK